jgi:hypothetical protein
MTECKTCPLVVAIGKIRGGGLYTDDEEQNNNNIVTVGGNGDTEYICDDTSYWINLRLIETARFEISKPSLDLCKRKFQRMYGDYKGKTREYIYTKIIAESQMKKLMYKQFIALVESLVKLDDWLLAKVDDNARKGKPINITVPDIMLLPHVDVEIIYKPEVLTSTMNSILQYMSKLNINSLLKDPLTIEFGSVPDFNPVNSVNMNDIIPYPDKLTSADDYLTAMKKLSDFEIETAKYVQDIEKYHCEVISKVNCVFHAMQKIMMTSV